MSATSKKTTTKGKRYTDAQKQEVVAFAKKVNAENGRGGQAAAARKFGISVLTVSGWLKKAGAAAKAPKSAAAAKVAVKPAKKAGKKASPQGKRYSDAQKKDVVDFVLAVNTSKGRGGLSAATKKFRISPLTISSWLKKAGAQMPKGAKAAKAAKVAKAKAAPASGGLSAKGVLALGKQVAKVDKHLAKLKLMLSASK